MSETVLVVGGGGREHAIAEELALSEEVDHVYLAPGNAGTGLADKVTNVDIAATNIPGLTAFAREHREGLTVVAGPEKPLIAGLGDAMRADRIPVFGPNADAARLEGSKIFACEFMSRYRIPQPNFVVVRSREAAETVMSRENPRNIVLKADGDAEGKGVVLPDTHQEMRQTFQLMLSGEGFNGAGRNGVVVQERLTGPELSVFVVGNGRDYSVIPFFAQDHKRLLEGDKGPNTGGMGAYSPVPREMLDDSQLQAVQNMAGEFFWGMQDRGTPYQGVMFIGVMLAEERFGQPVALEVNCRLGDPEAQVILPTLAASGVDVYGVMRDIAHGRQVGDLGAPRFAGHSALTVCLAADGYPGPVMVRGDEISGLDKSYDNVRIHHGSTKLAGGKVVTNGGRVLYVTGLDDESLQGAKDAAEAAIGDEGVHFRGMQYRRDIGYRALAAENRK